MTDQRNAPFCTCPASCDCADPQCACVCGAAPTAGEACIAKAECTCGDTCACTPEANCAAS